MPTLTASSNINSTASDNSTLTSASITSAAGDVIVVKGLIEDAAVSYTTPTDSQGNTYTQRCADSTVGRVWAAIWTAVNSGAASVTVSLGGMSGAGRWHSMTVENWGAASLAATPAINSPDTGTGAPSATITTTAALSVVTWLNGDWNAVSPTGRTYDTTSAIPTEDGLHDRSGTAYVAYYAWQTAVSAGSQTLGLTAPGAQKWTLLAVEILDVPGGGGGAVDSDQFGTLAWQ